MTDKQQEYINWIEDMTGITFDPSKESLSDYINNNKQKASEEWELRCELEGIIRGY